LFKIVNPAKSFGSQLHQKGAREEACDVAAVMNCRISAGVIPVAIRPGIVLN